MSKFNIGEIVYIKVTYRQNQNIIGCGLITDVKNIGLSKDDYQYKIKFIDSDGKGLCEFLMNQDESDTIDEKDIYRPENLIELLNDLETDLFIQFRLTEESQKNENL